MKNNRRAFMAEQIEQYRASSAAPHRNVKNRTSSRDMERALWRMSRLELDALLRAENLPRPAWLTASRNEAVCARLRN